MRWLAALFLALFCAVRAGAQDTGGFLGDLLQDALTGQNRNVTVTGLDGALSSRATLKRLTIADADGIWITIEEAELDWSRSALLGGNLDINTLRAKRIVLARLPGGSAQEDAQLPSPEAMPFALPDLPVSIRIGNLGVDQLSLGQPVLGIAAELTAKGGVSLVDGQLDARLDVTRTDRPGDRIGLIAGFENTDRQLTLDLAVAEAAGGLVSEILGLPGRPSVRMTAKGAGPVSDFTADLRLATDGADRLAGQVRLRGADESSTGIGFEADVSGDVTALFAPEYRPFFGDDLTLKARGTSGVDGAFDLPEVRIETRMLRLSGALRLAAGGALARADLAGEIADRAGGAPVLLPLPGAETRVMRAEITLGFDAAQGMVWSLDSQIDDLQRPDFNARNARIQGQGTLDQSGDAPVMQGNVLAGAQGLAVSDPALAQALGEVIALGGRFDWTGGGALNLREFAFRAGNLTGEMDARIDGLSLSGKAQINAPNLARFAALSGLALSGAAEIAAEGTGGILSGAFDVQGKAAAQDLQTGIAQIDGLLDGPVRLSLDAARDENGTRLRAFDLRGAALSAQASGRIATGAAKFDLTARLSDLGRLLPALPGPLTLSGTLTQAPAQGLRAALRLNGPEGARAALTAQTEGDDLIVDFDAALARLEVLVPALKGGFQASGTARRSADGQWQGQIETMGSAGLTGRFDGGFAEADQTVDLRFDAALDRLERLVPGFSGALNAKGRARRGGAGNWQANAVTRGSAGLAGTFKATYAEASGDAEVYFDAALARIERLIPEIAGTISAFGEASLSGSQWQVEASGDGPGGIAMNLAGSYDQTANAADLTVRGQAHLGLANSALRPNSIRGVANVDLALRGTPGLAALSGAISTSGARLVLPSLAQTVEDLAANVTLSNGRAQIAVSAAPRAGGRIQVQGPVALTPPFDGTLGIELLGLVLTNNLNFDSSASGRLRLAGPLAGGATLSGQVDFGPTEINIAATSGSVSAAPIPTIAHVGEPFGVRRTRARAGLIGGASSGGGGPAYGLDLVLNAPARIFARGRGLNAELGGRLTVRGTTANVIPTGQIALIRGTLDLLGRRLSLDEGRVTLQGSFDPYLRFSASTSTSEGDATIAIAGPLSAPEIEVTSQPERPSEEALALLLFGDKFTDISPLKIAQLASQLATLSGRGGGVTGRLRQGLGVDNLDLGTDDDGTAQVGVGTYLADGLYSDVTVNAEGESEVTLNLDVTDTLTLKGSVDSEGNTGIGLFFEKDY